MGAAGRAYLNWAASMAVGLGTGVPWVMCKQNDAPDPVASSLLLLLVSFASLLICLRVEYDLSNSRLQINSCNGFYCDDFTPNKPYKPTMWTESWSGW